MTWNAGMLRAQARFDEDANTAPIDHAVSAGLGLTALRWNFLKSHTASYDFSIYGSALSAMNAVGMKHYLTLFGPTYNSASATAFATWAEQAMLWHVSAYPTVLEAVELWNEPNGSWPINSDDYMKLITLVDAKIRAHSSLSAVKLVAPCAGGGFLDRCIASGMLALTTIKAISYHDYSTPETIYANALVHNAKLASAGRSDLRLVISEWGAIPSTVQPAAAEKALACLKAANCGASYFPLQDYPSFPDKGLLTSAGSAKTAATSFINFFNHIPEALPFNKRDSLSSSSVYSFLFKSGSSYMRTIWTTNSAGETIHINGASTALTLSPIYVSGNVTVTM